MTNQIEITLTAFVQNLQENQNISSFFFPPIAYIHTHSCDDEAQTLRCIKSEELTDGIKQ